MRVNCYAIDLRNDQKKKKHQIHRTTYDVSSASFSSVRFSCLLGARARTSKQEKRTEEKETLQNSFPDDSGSKLRDKEQQRLSSK